MKHPDRETLALHAGGDLGFVARWKTARHLAECAGCRAEAAAFEEMRAALPEMFPAPDVPWNRLAAEMKANIRLGLAAGECVPAEAAAPRFRPARAAMAFAGVAALFVLSAMIERPSPVLDAARFQGVEVQSTARGIQVRERGGSLRLLHGGAREADVSYSPSAQGSMRASYVDSETNYVTVTDVYAN